MSRFYWRDNSDGAEYLTVDGAILATIEPDSGEYVVKPGAAVDSNKLIADRFRSVSEAKNAVEHVVLFRYNNRRIPE